MEARGSVLLLILGLFFLSVVLAFRLDKQDARLTALEQACGIEQVEGER
jgi:hypothetical protein